MAAASYYQTPPRQPTLTNSPQPPVSTEMNELPSNPHSTHQTADQYHQYPDASYQSQNPDLSYKPHQQKPSQSYQPQLEEQDSKLNGHTPIANDPAPHDKPTDRLRRQRYEKWKRWLKILKATIEAITIIINIVIFGIMVWVNVEYYRTKDDTVDGDDFWPVHTKVWPSIMLLAASFVTLVVSIGTLIAYCVNFKRARGSWKVTIAKYVLSVAAWIVISTIYRIEKKHTDIWGWSCGDKAAAVQVASHGKVNFSGLCSLQVRAFPQNLLKVESELGEPELTVLSTGKFMGIINRTIRFEVGFRHRTLLVKSQGTRGKAEVCGYCGRSDARFVGEFHVVAKRRGVE